MRFLIVSLIFGLGSFFLFGCSRSSKDSVDLSRGTVAEIFLKGAGETVLTEKDPNEASLVSLDKIKEIIDTIRFLMEEINEIGIIISSYQKEAIEINELLKNFSKVAETEIPENTEENENLEGEANEEDETEDEEPVEISEVVERDQILKALEARVKAIEDFGKEVKEMDKIKDKDREKISDLLVGLKEKLVEQENNLAKSDEEEFKKIIEEIALLKVFSGELPRFKELILVYQGNFLIEEEVAPVLLEAEEKVKGLKDKGADVSSPELILAKTRQASIESRKVFETIKPWLENLDFSQNAGANEIVSSRVVEDLAVAGENLGIIRENLFSLSGF